MHDKRAARVALMLLLIASPVFAQPQPPRTATDKDAQSSEAARLLEQSAVSLLEEAVADAQELKLVENRVRVQAAAAALLWPRDEDAARQLFMRAADVIRTLSQELDPSDRHVHERSQIVRQLRNDMLQAAVGYDPRLALEFLRATRQSVPLYPLHTGMKQTDHELMLETELASRVALQDPGEAARLLEEGLRRGFSPNITNALGLLARKDPEAASRLAAAAIARLRPEDMLGSYDAAAAAAQLLTLTRPPDPTPRPGEEESKGRRIVTDRLDVDAASRRALIETLTTVVLNTTGNRNHLYPVFSALRTGMPEIERYAPARAAAVRRQLAEFERGQDQGNRLRSEYQELFQKNDPAALIGAAEKAPNEIRDELYRAAALRLFSEDFERARAVAEKIEDPHRRAHLLREFEQQRAWRAAERGEFEAARQLAASLPTPEERAIMLVTIARAALNHERKSEAAVLLTEARTHLGPRARNRDEMNVHLEMASIYVSLDPVESFTILEAVIAQLNELIAAAAVVDGFTFNAFREGEMSAHGGLVWPEFIRRTAECLSRLAAHDFDRSRAAARSFNRADARVVAQLHLAQVILSNASAQRGNRGTTVNSLPIIINPVQRMNR